MTPTRVSCIRGKPKLVGKGLHRRVFKIRNFVLKVERSGGKGIEELKRKAVAINTYQREIRKNLNFLPAYYGTILAEVIEDGTPAPTIITFHEYVKPLPTYSIKSLMAIFDMIGKAGENGYVLDIKSSNFGKKGKRIFYLDEYGIGKGPLPPDVLEDINKFVRFALGKLRVKKSR